MTAASFSSGALSAETNVERRIRPSSYIVFFLIFLFVLVVGHAAFANLPYFWDELGQFVPAALDIYHSGAWIPHSAVPNVHPPGVMAWLAAVWHIAGYSVAATRLAMLLMAALGTLFVFLLAIQLCRGVPGAPAFTAVLLLLLDPLFYTQSMMAQLDMPAMVFAAGGLLYFLRGRHIAAVVACTALVMAKETGLVLPLVFAGILLTQKGQRRKAIYYAIPAAALAAWLFVLWRATGYVFGDPGFANYNIVYALHPARIALSLARRVFYLFVADFRWIAAISIVFAFRRGVFKRPGWNTVCIFAAAHVLLVSFLGGAELERYLLPVIPLVYIAAAAGWASMPALWRNLSIAGMACGLIAGSFVNPPWPFPYENNLAMADFIELQQQAAQFLEHAYPRDTITTAWPLTAALRNPELGYVQHGFTTEETGDFHYSSLNRLGPGRIGVLALYSRTWEPSWGVLRWKWVRQFLNYFYEYEPPVTEEECEDKLGLKPVIRWTRRGQWMEIYARTPAPGEH